VSHLTIRLLGPFEVTLDGKAVTSFATDKVRALLAYLAMTPDQPHRRETLAGLLWPEFPERSARASLRNALGNLRRAIGDHEASPPCLLVTRQTIRFNTESDHWLDTAEFSSLLASSDAAGDALEPAVALYRGSLLEGFSIPDSAAFEEWLVLTREQLGRQVGDALRDLVAWHQDRGAYDQALPYAWRLVELEPWREESHRQLMRLLVLGGQRSAALAQYEVCRRVLADDLGVEPEAQTTRLYEQIRDGELVQRSVPPAVARAPELVPGLPAFLIEGAEESPPPLFVARERELTWLEGRLEDTLAGNGQVLFVTGGPGRGKTALLAEFARQAMASHPNLLVATGSCNAYSGVGDPYLPFREVLAMLTGDVEAAWAAGTISRDHAVRLWTALPQVCQALLDRGPHVAPALIPCVPLLDRAVAAAPAGATWPHQLADRIDCSQTASELLEETDLFQQVTNLLRSLAKEQPLLLMLDDMQWVDAASASLLFHLGRRLAGSRILVAGAYRPEETVTPHAGSRQPGTVPHPLRQVLAELQRQLGDILLDLAGVPELEGRQFVDSLLDTETNRLGEGFRTALFAHTNGHPLFTVELLRAMQDRGDLIQDEAGAWVEGPALDWTSLPPRVEGIIMSRIGRLDRDLQDFLAVASVEGETFTAQVVARVQGLSDRQALQLLSQELEARHRLVREHSLSTEGSRWLVRYRFSHALFQHYLYQSLGEGERALLHGQVATVLEELYQNRLEEVAFVLAHHCAEAHDDDRALDYFTLAGDVALAAYANREAEGYYRRALALELGPPELEAAHLLSQLGEALARQGRFIEAVGIWQEAIEGEKALGNGDAVARLFARSAWAASQSGHETEHLRLCLEGLAQVGDTADGPGLARLLHETAMAFMDQALGDESLPFAQEALEMAERLEDVELQAQTLATWSTLPRHSLEESIALARKAVALAEDNGLLLAGQRAHTYLGYRLSVRVDRSEAYWHFRRGAELAGQAGLTTQQGTILARLAGDMVRSGRFEEAEQVLCEARALQGDLAEPTLVSEAIGLVEMTRLGFLGRWADCTENARELVSSMRARGAGRDLALAAIYLAWSILEPIRFDSNLAGSDLEEAEAAFLEATEVYDRSFSGAVGIMTRGQWASLHLLQGRLADAQRLLAEADEIARALPLSPRVNGHHHWLAARIAAAAGQWDEAMASFRAACQSLDEGGEHWWHARVALSWAQAYASRGEPGDRQRAAELLRQARQAFQGMGVPRYAAIAEERLQELGISQT
jgi:DNA-binding SARP family transcriptional activator/predicted ATPase